MDTAPEGPSGLSFRQPSPQEGYGLGELEGLDVLRMQPHLVAALVMALPPPSSLVTVCLSL